MATDTIPRPASSSALGSPWVQLCVGLVCMIMVANYQYGWTLFVGPIGERYGWSKAAIQVTFTLFVLFETWLVPAEGWLVDKFGPRWMIVSGGILVLFSWMFMSFASSLGMFYFAGIIGGIGAGAVYGTCIGNAVKWFPGRRGLAAGLTAAGFGMGSALTIIPIANMIKTSGFEHTFLVFALFQGIVTIIFGFLIHAPPKTFFTTAPKIAPGASRYQASPLQMLSTPVFWVMYLMFIMMAAGGLMATAQLAPIAKDFGVEKIPVSLLGITLPALTFALTIDRILNGLTRPFFGWVSDHIGREQTMFIAFLIEGLGIIALANLGTNPVWFVVLSGLVFFAWGEIYSLFPSTVTDTYGATYATTNTGFMYTAKGTAAILVPFTSIIAAKGNWHPVFMMAATLAIIAGLMAVFVLKPMRAAYTSRLSSGGVDATAKFATR
jgi:MFS transporter, OFA family, oxalate/formate antiporter